jgi:hypothetical protein
MNPRIRRFKVLAIAAGCTAVLGCAGALSVGAFAESNQQNSTTTQESPEPQEGYVAPTGPTLSDEALRKIALANAAGMHEDSPNSVEAFHASLSAVGKAVDPDTMQPDPNETTEGMRAWLASDAVLLVVRGKFRYDNAPIPQGHEAPTGSVLGIAIDAHDGTVEGIAVLDELPAGVKELGPATDLA